MSQRYTIPSLQGIPKTFGTKRSKPTLQPNFAKDPFSPSRSNPKTADAQETKNSTLIEVKCLIMNKAYSMVWESQVEYFNPLLTSKTIIHGHRPITVQHCETLVNENKQVINIDTGCVYKEKEGYGKLTAIELYSKKLFSI